VNEATATGRYDGEDVDDTDEETVKTTPPAPSISILKTVTSTPGTAAGYVYGDEITYQIVVKNTGNVNLYDIVVTDTLTGCELNDPEDGTGYTIDTNGKAVFDEPLIPDASITLTASYTVTAGDVVNGSVRNDADVVGFDFEENRITDSDFVTVVIDQDILNQTITVRGNHDEFVYDGISHKVEGYTVDNIAALEALGFVVTAVTSDPTESNVTDPSVPNTVISVKVMYHDEDVTEYPTITIVKIPGWLIIEPRPLTITAGSAEKVYDATSLTLNELADVDPVVGLQALDYLADITITGSQADVGTSNNTPSGALIKNSAGIDVTDNYDITYVPGTLKVTERTLTITAGSKQKVYDATTLIWNELESVVGLQGGDYLADILITGSQTEVGTSENVASGAVIKNSAGTPVTGNYIIDYVDGELEVTRKTLVITAGDAEKVYDATTLTWNELAAVDPVVGLEGGDYLADITITGSRVDVGESANIPSGALIKNSAGVDVTKNYDIEYVNGTLKITQAKLVITAGSAEKVYDATSLTRNELDDDDPISGLQGGDYLADITIEGSRSTVGSSPNKASKALIKNSAGEVVTENYDIEYVDGTLTITQAKLVITAGSAQKVYDATSLSLNELESVVELQGGDYLADITIEGSRSTVGSSENVASDALIKNSAGEIVTENYDIEYVDGTLTITQATLVITAGSDQKIYDASALMLNELESVEGLQGGDYLADIIITGSRVIVGSSDNVPTEAFIKNSIGEDATENYAIEYVNGTLTVTPRPLTITAASDLKIFDTLPLMNGGYEAEGLAEGDDVFSLFVTGSQTFVGTSANVPSGAVILNAEGEDVTDCYTIEYVDGTLTITPFLVQIIVYYQYAATGAMAAPTYFGTVEYGYGYNVVSPIIPGFARSAAVIAGTINSVMEGVLEFTVTYTAIPGGFILEDPDVPLAGIGSRNVGDCTE
jgi:hypothetical protein